MADLIEEMEAHASGIVSDASEGTPGMPAFAIEDTEDTGDDDAIDTEEDRPLSWKEKKRQRYTLLQAKQQADAENLRLRERLARLEGRQDEAQAYFRQQAAQAQAPRGPDPMAAQLKDLDERIEQAEQAYAANPNKTPELYQKTKDAIQRMRDEAIQLRVQRGVRESLQSMVVQEQEAKRQNAAQSEGQNFFRAAVQRMYPDIVSKPERLQRAQELFEGMWKSGRYGSAAEANIAAFDAARDEFESWDEVESAKAKTASRGVRSGRGGGSQGRTYTPTHDDVRIAKAMFPGLGEREAVQKWVNKVGKKLVQGRQS